MTDKTGPRNVSISGALPQPSRRRRNEPKIPTTLLPAEGYDGPVPTCPYRLGTEGRKWWRWAWRTPSAAAWGPGDTYSVARRAQCEDDLAALELPNVDLAEYLDIDDSCALDRLGDMMRRLRAIAGGRVGILKLAGDLDKRLGLDPKALLELRWTMAPPKSGDSDDETSDEAPATSDRWGHLEVVGEST